MRPSVPRPFRIVLVLATIASLLAIPSLAAAAPKGSDVTFDVRPLIGSVSPGRDGAFEVFVHNAGKATLTHATLTATISGAVGATTPAGCDGFPVVTCVLGSLASGDSRTLLFVVTSPAAGSIGFQATLQVDAGSGNPSHDQFSDGDTIGVETSTSYFGAWQGANASLTGSVGTIGGGGHQTATVNVPGFVRPYPATVTEVSGDICGIAGIGQGVSMSLAGGEVVTPYITVTLTYDAEARGTRTPGNVSVVHDSDCNAPLVKGCQHANCFNAWWDGNGPSKKLVVQALLPHNGIVKGF